MDETIGKIFTKPLAFSLSLVLSAVTITSVYLCRLFSFESLEKKCGFVVSDYRERSNVQFKILCFYR